MVFKSLKFLTMYLILFNLGMMQKNMQASQKRFQGRLKINRQLKKIPSSVTTANNYRNPSQQRRIPSSVTSANTCNSDSGPKTLRCNVKHTIKSLLIICLMQNCPIQKLYRNVANYVQYVKQLI